MTSSENIAIRAQCMAATLYVEYRMALFEGRLFSAEWLQESSARCAREARKLMGVEK